MTQCPAGLADSLQAVTAWHEPPASMQPDLCFSSIVWPSFSPGPPTSLAGPWVFGQGFVKVAFSEITMHASFYLLGTNPSDNGIKIASRTGWRCIFCSEWRSPVGSRGSWPPLTRSAAAPPRAFPHGLSKKLASRRPAGRPAGGRGSSKFETGNWKLDTALSFEFPVSSFAFS